MSRTEECANCSGSGEMFGSFACDQCSGKGTITIPPTELESLLLEALGDMIKLAQDCIENWSDEETARFQKAADVFTKATQSN